MHLVRRIAFVPAGILFIALISSWIEAHGQSSVYVPTGFSLIETAAGVELYRKDYQGGMPDFVQVIDLSQGASIRFLHGNIVDPGIGQGDYGGDSPKYRRMNIQQYWTSLSSLTNLSFCVVNGQFFSTNDDPTELAFPLKIDGNIVSDGYGIDEFVNQKVMFEVWDDTTDISAFTSNGLYTSMAPSVIVGLSESANKSPDKLTGRTFIGIGDKDNDDRFEVILIFTSRISTQAHAAAVLRDFGAKKVAMLDGGNSSQLACRDTVYVESSRSIPQAIGVLSSVSSASSVTVLRKPDWAVLVEGETLNVEIEIINTGMEIWEPNEYQLVNISNNWGTSEEYQLRAAVNPGETYLFSFVTEPFNKWGIYTSEWGFEHRISHTRMKSINLRVIVLPEEMEDQKNELLEKINEWQRDQLDNIEKLIRDWIIEQRDNLFQIAADWFQEQLLELWQSNCGSVVTIIPLVVIPIMAFSLRRRC